MEQPITAESDARLITAGPDNLLSEASPEVTTAIDSSEGKLVPETLADPPFAPVDADRLPESTRTEVVATKTSEITVDTEIASTTVKASILESDITERQQPQAGPSRLAGEQQEHSTIIVEQAGDFDIRVRPAAELLGGTGEVQTPSPHRRSKKRRTSEVPEGSTPLREQLQRSREKQRRTNERLSHDHAAQGSSSHRLSKRASSPDKVYAYVGLLPRKPPAAELRYTATPPPAAKPYTPPPVLTEEQRWESVERGREMINNVAASYRARITALSRKYGASAKDIADATKELRVRGAAGKGGARDWETLEQMLAARH